MEGLNKVVQNPLVVLQNQTETNVNQENKNIIISVHPDEHSTPFKEVKISAEDLHARHQILIFSCHPHAWQDLGVAARSLV